MDRITNDSRLPLLLTISQRTAANLAVSSAQAIDRKLKETSSELITAIERLAEKHRLYDSIHCKLHLDQIEEPAQYIRLNQVKKAE